MKISQAAPFRNFFTGKREKKSVKVLTSDKEVRIPDAARIFIEIMPDQTTG
jgi:hypothetical protein